MARPTNGQQALREYVEETRAAVMEAETQVDELMAAIVGYAADGRLSKGTALGLTNHAQEVKTAFLKVVLYSKLSLVKLDDIIKERNTGR